MAERGVVGSSLARGVNRALRVANLELRTLPAQEDTAPVVPQLPTPPDRWSTDPLRAPGVLQSAFAAGSIDIVERHRGQSEDDIAVLKRRYSEPTFGPCRVWDLVERLACCVDPSDQRLYGASQQMHVLQMLTEMEPTQRRHRRWCS